MKTHESASRLRRGRLFAAILLGTSASAQAARIDYSLGLSYLDSDNINLSEDNQTSEGVLSPALRFNASEEGARISLQARGDFEFRNYVHGRYPDEWRNAFAGQLNWSLLPGRLNLVVEDYLSNNPITVRDGNYPGNLQQVNVLIGGPTFFAHISDRTRAQFDLRAASANAEITNDFDGKRYSAAGKLLHEVDAHRQAGLNAVHSKVEFDDPTAGPDYTRNDLFASYRQTLRKGEATLEAGYSRINHSQGGGDRTSPLLRAEVRWESGRNQITVRARRQFADAVQDLIIRDLGLDDPVIPDLANSSVLVHPEVYRQRFLDVDYRYRADRWRLRVRPLYAQYRYLGDNLNDRQDRGVFFGLDYFLRPRLTLSLQGVARNREFTERDRQDQDRVYSLRCNYQLTRHWSWEAALYRNTRTSTLSDPEYKENAARFTITWRR